MVQVCSPNAIQSEEKSNFSSILCSNFETGVRATRNFYCDITGNPDYTPDNKIAFTRFKERHPDTFRGLRGNRRPLQWRMLWCVITEHEEGICDYTCRDFEGIEQDEAIRQTTLEWLESAGYLVQQNSTNAWQLPIQQYRLNWTTIRDNLRVEPPTPFEPLSLKPTSLKEISQ